MPYISSKVPWCGVCTTRDHTDMEPVSVPFYQTWAVVSDYSCATHVVTETVHGLVPRLSFSVWWESRNEALHHDNLCQRWHTWYKSWSFISSIPEPTRSTIYHHWVLPHIPTGGYYNVTLTCGYHNVTLTCAKLIGNEHRHCSQKGRKKIDWGHACGFVYLITG